MKPIVFLEKNEITNEFITTCTYDAWLGFSLLGFECRPFLLKDMDWLDISKETIVSGYIRTVRKAFDLLGCSTPDEVSIPEELVSFAKRKIWTSTLGDIRENEPNCFIKPLKGQKLFTGHVRNGNMGYLLQTAALSDDTEVLCSEVVDFTTEYRGFVLDQKLIGWKHYKGDFSLMPDINAVYDAISQFHSAPVAYSIDFGLSTKGETILVEINDAFALGSYGLEPTKYASMIEARWHQIVQG